MMFLIGANIVNFGKSKNLGGVFFRSASISMKQASTFYEEKCDLLG